MPIENGRVRQIVFEEVESIEDRCPGYKQEIKSAIAEIIDAERQHSIQKTRIQQIVDDKCDVAGQFLANMRDRRGAANE